MWLIFLFIVLILWLFYYDEIMFRLYQVVFYKPGEIVRTNTNNVWINVDIGNVRYDLFIPLKYDDSGINGKITAKNGNESRTLKFFPALKPLFTISEMGFDKITVKTRTGTKNYQDKF